MRRGALVTVAVSGHYGKPRPALIVQADAYVEHPSITVLPPPYATPRNGGRWK